MLLPFHTPRHETNINLYTHHSTPPCSLRVSPARALRRTSRNRSWNVGVSPILESLSKGMGSIRRSTRRLARLRHTKVNPAVDSQVDDGLVHRLSLALVHGYRPAQVQGYLLTCLVASVVSEALLHVPLNPRLQIQRSGRIEGAQIAVCIPRIFLCCELFCSPSALTVCCEA